jgi:replicative DNA helicase
MTIDTIPPQNTEAEEAVLAACLTDQESLEDFAGLLRPEDFYRTANRLIFGVCMDLLRRSTPVDIVSVASELKALLKLDEVGGNVYISSLLDFPPATDPSYYGGLIRDAAIRRRALEIANAITKRAYRADIPTSDLLDFAQGQILGISAESSPVKSVLFKDLSFAAVDRYESLAKAGCAITGIPSGFRDIDNTTCGFQAGDLIIIAARPSMGKTALALNIARNAAGAGHPCGFFSLEMGRDQLIDRTISSESGVNSLKFRSGRFSEDDWERISGAQEVLHELPLWIDDYATLSYGDLWRRARRMKKEHDIRLFIVDYLQLLTGDRGNGRVEEVSSISRNLKAMARELRVPVIVLSQLSRACESRDRDKKRPRLSDLRDSGAIEQDADVVAFIYRDEVYNENSKDKGIAELSIAKHRNGPTGTVRLRFYSRNTRFSEVENG